MLRLSKGALAAALAFATLAAGAEALPCEGRAGDVSAIALGAPLTLPAALSEVRRISPAIRAAGLEALAVSADGDQAGRRLNPSLSIELDNFAGGGALGGFDQTETTFALEQTFRLGGKRQLGERAARAREALASAECAVILRQAELETALLYAELIAASELLRLAEESASLGEDLASVVERRVDAGASAPPELARARADAAASAADVAGAEANVDRLRYALSVMWGEAEPVFGRLEPVSFYTEETSDTETDPHPELDAADAARRAYEAEADLARTAAIPDITVSVGFRRFEETGDNAFIAGISVPLPLFDRGRDAARASAYRQDAASLSRAGTEQRLLARQRTAISAQRAAQTRLDILTMDALPAAEEAYRAARRGYQIGRFDLTTTLNARAALIEARVALIEAQLALQTETIRLRALIGAAPFDGDLP